MKFTLNKTQKIETFTSYKEAEKEKEILALEDRAEYMREEFGGIEQYEDFYEIVEKGGEYIVQCAENGDEIDTFSSYEEAQFQLEEWAVLDQKEKIENEAYPLDHFLDCYYIEEECEEEQ